MQPENLDASLISFFIVEIRMSALFTLTVY